jgi:ketosteroid isomerase-like protein
MNCSILPFVLATLALSACNAGAKKEQAEVADTATIVRELKSIETAWNADYNAHAVDKLVGYYADDAALANPGSALATDATSRRTEIEKFVADPSMKIEFASDRMQVAQSGELATTRGNYSIQTTDPATKKVRTDTGSYLTVWKKQADGNWKAVEDFVTPGVPATTAAQ